jgi:hypothetical protein
VRLWAITRQRCKELLWLPLKGLLDRHRIDARQNDSELRVFLPNRSEIRLVGADKDKEAQKKRGDGTVLEIITEAQLFGPFLRPLVQDVIEPCTFDKRGTVALEGTPAVLCAGHWFSITGGAAYQSAKRWTSTGRPMDGAMDGSGWSCHRWSVLDNPYVPHAAEELARLKSKRGWTDEHPTYRREWLAQWVNDEGALFYAFHPDRNLHRRLERDLLGPGWIHVLGWDLGLRDDMAKVVWAFHAEERLLLEAFSWKEPGALLETCAALDADLFKRFNIVAQVADTGGGGALFVAEHSDRHPELPTYEAAKKPQKYEHVRLFNDELRSGRIQLREGSPLHAEMSVLPKDPDWPDEKVPREDPRFANHCCDAGLYAFRRAYPHLLEKPAAPPKAGSRELAEAEERRMEEQLIERVGSQQRDWWEEPWT